MARRPQPSRLLGLGRVSRLSLSLVTTVVPLVTDDPELADVLNTIKDGLAEGIRKSNAKHRLSAGGNGHQVSLVTSMPCDLAQDLDASNAKMGWGGIIGYGGGTCAVLSFIGHTERCVWPTYRLTTSAIC